MLNEASLQNLDNNSYRKESFKKYASLKKPNWKRVGYKYEEPGEFKPFNSTVIKNTDQDGVAIRGLNDSLKDLERLSNDNEYGLGDFFKLQNYTFYNEGKYIKINERKKVEKPIYINYNFNKENNFLIDYNIIEVEDLRRLL